MTEEQLDAEQPVIADVLARDDRIDFADVVLTKTRTNAQLDDVTMKVTGHTSEGPFSFTKSVLELTSTIGDPES
jgi:hypothetical protein